MRITCFIIICISISSLCLAHPGVGIAEDSKGNIYYTDLEQVWKITPDGKKQVVVPNVHTHELFMDESDNLFGEHVWYNGEKADTWGYYVWKFSPNGKIEKVIPNTEGFLSDYSFVRDHFGRMYWADRTGPCQKVVRQNADRTKSEFSNPCFSNIRWMKVEGDDLLVVDFQDLKKVDKNGRVQTVASKIADKKVTESTRENQNSVFGVWGDKQGNLYAAVYSRRAVIKFLPDGKEQTVLSLSFPWGPSGGLVDSNGNLWVLESSFTNSVRVESITPSGRRTTY